MAAGPAGRPAEWPADGVRRLSRCLLHAESGAWAYAGANARRIEQHWASRSAASPRLFNGRIYLLAHMTIEGDVLSGRMLPAEFKAFLHWRDRGCPEAGVRDGFGSALIRSREGHVLLGRQGDGHINAGLAYLPGGFIDGRDVDAGGAVDIEASIAREVREETGLDPAALTRVPGLYLTCCGPLVSIAVEYRSASGAIELREAMLAGMAHDGEAELSDIVTIRTMRDAEPALVPPYARLLLAHVLGEPGA